MQDDDSVHFARYNVNSKLNSTFAEVAAILPRKLRDFDALAHHVPPGADEQAESAKAVGCHTLQRVGRSSVVALAHDLASSPDISIFGFFSRSVERKKRARTLIVNNQSLHRMIESDQREKSRRLLARSSICSENHSTRTSSDGTGAGRW